MWLDGGAARRLGMLVGMFETPARLLPGRIGVRMDQDDRRDP